MTPLLVAVGAAVGATLRFWVGHHLDGRTHWGTLAVNVAGSFVLGSSSAPHPPTPPRRCSAPASAAA